MGLDAFVPCRCWEEGRCKPAPEGFEIFRDPETGALDALNCRDPRLDREALDAWRYSSCEHDEGEYASERISNWGGVTAFRDELSRLADRFPVLLAEIPSVNGGTTSPEAARAALLELDIFERSELGTFVRLHAVSNGELIADRIDSHGGVFVLGGGSGYDIGLDDCALFIRSRATQEVVFRSKGLTQTPMDEKTRFTDVDSGRSVQIACSMLGGQFQHPPPQELEVVTGRQLPSDFDFISGALRRIFRVSVELRSPVIWC